MPTIGVFTIGVDPRQQHGSFYYRMYLPFTWIERETDWTVAWTARVEAAKDGHFIVRTKDGTVHHPEVFVTQMYRVPNAYSHIMRARSTGQILIADVDDDWTRIPKPNVSGRDQYTGDRHSLMDSMCAYDLVICSTAPIERTMKRLQAQRTVVIRNALEVAKYRVHDPAKGMVAWVGSTPWRAHDLEILAAAGLDAWLERTGQALYHAGAIAPPRLPELARTMGLVWDGSDMPPQAYQLCGVDPDRCFVSPIVPMNTGRYWDLWDRVGVSLIPLERCQFNTAKSWLKALESCAAGVPYLVSAGFPEQDLLIDEGAKGIRCRNDRPREWVHNLDLLLDPDYRRALGEANRAVAERHDISQHWFHWWKAIEDAYARVDPRTIHVDHVPR